MLDDYLQSIITLSQTAAGPANIVYSLPNTAISFSSSQNNCDPPDGENITGNSTARGKLWVPATVDSDVAINQCAARPNPSTNNLTAMSSQSSNSSNESPADAGDLLHLSSIGDHSHNALSIVDSAATAAGGFILHAANGILSAPQLFPATPWTFAAAPANMAMSPYLQAGMPQVSHSGTAVLLSNNGTPFLGIVRPSVAAGAAPPMLMVRPSQPVAVVTSSTAASMQQPLQPKPIATAAPLNNAYMLNLRQLAPAIIPPTQQPTVAISIATSTAAASVKPHPSLQQMVVPIQKCGGGNASNDGNNGPPAEKVFVKCANLPRTNVDLNSSTAQMPSQLGSGAVVEPLRKQLKVVVKPNTSLIDLHNAVSDEDELERFALHQVERQREIVEQFKKETHDEFVSQLQRSGAQKPKILTHVIDGFVIEESAEPFPVSPCMFDDFASSESLLEFSEPPKLEPEDSRASIRSTSPPPLICKLCAHRIAENIGQSFGEFCSKQCKLKASTSSASCNASDSGASKLKIKDLPLPGKPVQEWSVAEVCAWLHSQGDALSNAAVRFGQEEIDGAALHLLKSDQMLTAPLNIKLGPALKITSAIQKLLTDQK